MVGQEILVLFIAVRICLLQPRTDGRAAEYTGLENRHTSNGIGGSNPSLSATIWKYGTMVLQLITNQPTERSWEFESLYFRQHF